ncbi:hypothetical protein CGCF415_v007229 [Colletotrichum fructicola]|uniref:Uncharacterized protein n=1 Tax=Colletotrichum fructicola (strain Nara gc5) TaxID=1213859 RepID=A0A7J6J1G2_COLFN|nr:hypothetical protein CGGC5_v008635 [Colletotrichum fructicola Nara gc5]KAF4890588.1 hypothetical protein CGCFRS4_v008678 [Colletotrichum fructicola]KAF4907596.1 hypothetical protein CGCF415_v007229 [Colletotrichum fructicola]KAF4936424.1 hypothetical protein CGCF245_v006688 [Colletotrichum fructicola]KAF5498826.1 hypothetical protein CGCF413_v007862 [Colletotrichum fructicola]
MLVLGVCLFFFPFPSKELDLRAGASVVPALVHLRPKSRGVETTDKLVSVDDDESFGDAVMTSFQAKARDTHA